RCVVEREVTVVAGGRLTTCWPAIRNVAGQGSSLSPRWPRHAAEGAHAKPDRGSWRDGDRRHAGPGHARSRVEPSGQEQSADHRQPDEPAEAYDAAGTARGHPLHRRACAIHVGGVPAGLYDRINDRSVIDRTRDGGSLRPEADRGTWRGAPALRCRGHRRVDRPRPRDRAGVVPGRADAALAGPGGRDEWRGNGYPYRHREPADAVGTRNLDRVGQARIAPRSPDAGLRGAVKGGNHTSHHTWGRATSIAA